MWDNACLKLHISKDTGRKKDRHKMSSSGYTSSLPTFNSTAEFLSPQSTPHTVPSSFGILSRTTPEDIEMFSATTEVVKEITRRFTTSILPWTNASDSLQHSTSSTENIVNNVSSMSANFTRFSQEICDELYTVRNISIFYHSIAKFNFRIVVLRCSH